MLGLIAGFIPDFSGGTATAVHYGYDQPERAALWLPASREAHAFLGTKNAYEASKANDGAVGEGSVLRLFPTGDFPAGDIISAVFFFLSLHEEWSCPERDRFGRFQAKHSLLGKLGLLDRPIVAEYAAYLGGLLVSAGFHLHSMPRFAGKPSAVCVTHDIDYITKSTPGLMYREAVKYFLLNGIKQPFGARARRLKEYAGFCLSKDRDPYRRSIARMKEEEEERGIRGTWLIKAGGSHKNDTGYLPSHPFVSATIASLLESGHEVGIHPSFEAHTDAAMFAVERESLMQYSGPVKSCRQHYLRFAYPETWRIQTGQGIAVDSTLGFAEREGFRNGACHPFMPYDLEHDEVIKIWEMPLMVMDGTLNSYRGLNAGESLERMKELLSAAGKYRGATAVLFHNVTYDPHDFPGWDAVFEQTLDAIAGQSESRGMTETLNLWLKGSEFDSGR